MRQLIAIFTLVCILAIVGGLALFGGYNSFVSRKENVKVWAAKYENLNHRRITLISEFEAKYSGQYESIVPFAKFKSEVARLKQIIEKPIDAGAEFEWLERGPLLEQVFVSAFEMTWADFTPEQMDLLKSFNDLKNEIAKISEEQKSFSHEVAKAVREYNTGLQILPIRMAANLRHESLNPITEMPE